MDVMYIIHEKNHFEQKSHDIFNVRFKYVFFLSKSLQTQTICRFRFIIQVIFFQFFNYKYSKSKLNFNS